MAHLRAENEALAEDSTRAAKLEREFKVLKGKNSVLLKDIRVLEVRPMGTDSRKIGMRRREKGKGGKGTQMEAEGRR